MAKAPQPSLVGVDLDDPSLYADLEKKYHVPTGGPSLDNVIVVDNVPRVPGEKEDKLKNVLRKTFKTLSAVKENGVHLVRGPDPENPAGTLTRSYAFVEFETAKDAQVAVAKGDGYRLDKTHVFACNLFNEIEQYGKPPGEFKAPEPEEYQEREYLKSWMMDTMARDQFVVRHSDETEVYYANKTDEPEKAHTRNRWTEKYVQWSPRGSYMTTFHRPGIAIWGGVSWKRLRRIAHENVRMILWSPEENYVITVSHDAVKADDGEMHNICVWDVNTGAMLKSFPAGKAFKWSHDDKYVARLGPNCINVFELPSMKLVDQKPLVADDVRDFEWSPTENTIAYWIPEVGNSPARVMIVDMPSRAIKRTKNLFNVHDCKLHWQGEGDFLAIKVDRATKTKKTTFASFELFRIREKEIPVDVLDLKDPLVAFAWEPQGDKFAIIHGEGNTLNVSFYTMDSEKRGAPVRLLKLLERKTANRLFWSPKGQYVVLAGLKGSNGSLEFWNVRDLEQMGVGEHYQCTDVEWDPSGRYVATSVSYWQTTMETGYKLWDFRGRLVFEKQIERFYSLSWRPRPRTLLSKEQIKEVRKNLKEYSAEFSRMDDLRENKASRVIFERRRQLMEDWEAYRTQRIDDHYDEHDERAKLRGYESDAGDEDAEVVEELVEEVVEESRVFLP